MPPLPYSHHTIDELSVHGTFLPKPFTPAQLLMAVQDALEGAAG